MYFSKIQLLPELSGQDLLHSMATLYKQHKMIWRLYGDQPDTKRDFIFRQERSADGRPCFFAVSARPPKDPDAMWLVDTKEYRPQIKQGDILRFSLRVNPTVCRSEGDTKKRHDVVMDRKKQTDWQRLSVTDKQPLPEMVHEAGAAWLARKAANHGFVVLPAHLHVDGYATHKFSKSGKRAISITTLDFAGILKVENVKLFTDTLFNGLGPAKGFGCGLLMVRRP